MLFKASTRISTGMPLSIWVMLCSLISALTSIFFRLGSRSRTWFFANGSAFGEDPVLTAAARIPFRKRLVPSTPAGTLIVQLEICCWISASLLFSTSRASWSLAALDLGGFDVAGQPDEFFFLW